MGEIADYYADLAMIAQSEYDDYEVTINAVLKNSDEDLVILTKHSKSPLIIGIRNYYMKHNRISEKQKQCLAKCIVNKLGF
jgi:hypothetical protein